MGKKKLKRGKQGPPGPIGPMGSTGAQGMPAQGTLYNQTTVPLVVNNSRGASIFEVRDDGGLKIGDELLIRDKITGDEFALTIQDGELIICPTDPIKLRDWKIKNILDD